jgi:hypothetical protein
MWYLGLLSYLLSVELERENEEEGESVAGFEAECPI